jgi:hypothetical protein
MSLNIARGWGKYAYALIDEEISADFYFRVPDLIQPCNFN